MLDDSTPANATATLLYYDNVQPPNKGFEMPSMMNGASQTTSFESALANVAKMHAADVNELHRQNSHLREEMAHMQSSLSRVLEEQMANELVAGAGAGGASPKVFGNARPQHSYAYEAEAAFTCEDAVEAVAGCDFVQQALAMEKVAADIANMRSHGIVPEFGATGEDSKDGDAFISKDESTRPARSQVSLFSIPEGHGRVKRPNKGHKHKHMRREKSEGDQLQASMEMEEVAKQLLKEAESLPVARKRSQAKLQVSTSFSMSASSRRARDYSRNRIIRRIQQRLQVVIENPGFDGLCASMILLNSGQIGANTEWNTTNNVENGTLVIMGHVCAAFFFFELVCRIAVSGRTFLTEDRGWNLFDSMLVLQSLFDLSIQLVSAGEENNEANKVLKALKTVKMLRILRVFRVFRFFRELSLLALLIIDSMKSLVWALLTLLIVIYVFSICFTQNVSDYIISQQETDEPHDSELRRYFGHVPNTVYTLLQSMLSGQSWGVYVDQLLRIRSPLLAYALTGLFFLYISFMILAVLNIITGVFVENAVETARTQRDFMVEKEMHLKERMVKEMHELFSRMDKDGSGSVTLEEIQAFMKQPMVHSYFKVLGLDPSDSERLFLLLDDDGSGDVAVDEFVDGCLRFKGEARSIDVYALMHLCRKMEGHIEEIMESVEKRTAPPVAPHQPWSSPISMYSKAFAGSDFTSFTSEPSLSSSATSLTHATRPDRSESHWASDESHHGNV